MFPILRCLTPFTSIVITTATSGTGTQTTASTTQDSSSSTSTLSTPPSSSTSSSGGTEPSPPSNNGLDTGGIIGIAIGVPTFVVTVVGVWIAWLSYKIALKKKGETQASAHGFGKYVRNRFSLNEGSDDVALADLGPGAH
jgi:hypothetical protein